MYRFHRVRTVRRVLTVMASLGCALVAFAGTGTAAFASEVPPTGGGVGTGPALPASVPTVISGGMAGWQIAVIALGGALLAAVAAVLLDRARAGRRALSAASA